jgi:hypothetical protein
VTTETGCPSADKIASRSASARSVRRRSLTSVKETTAPRPSGKSIGADQNSTGSSDPSRRTR